MKLKGLSVIESMTQEKSSELKIVLEDFNKEQRTADYR